MASCERELTVDAPSGGESAVAPCSHTDSEECCADGCLWLAPESGFPGRCFTHADNCADNAELPFCPGEEEVCFVRHFLGATAQCILKEEFDGQSFGVCLPIEDCPAGAECYQ